MPPDFRLITARLVIRSSTPADCADLVALEADPEVMRFLNGGRPVPLEGYTDGDFLTPRGTEPEVLVAHERETGEFVGWFALFGDGLAGGCKTAELGYRLRRDAWGKGYGAEGARALVAEALGNLGFDRVRAQTMTVNHGSRRVMEKAGFRYVETVFPSFLEPLAGGEQGEVIYEVWRDKV
ncbi:GNAT family N-acetyltransferase [Hydrogenophaga palleronii]|nr:GNAT family N-acetyltransferase [Hydrogenophaga palleronii]